jgi:hypothetical protein
MLKIFEYIVEVIGWLRIVASPLLIGIIAGAAIYYKNPNTTRRLIIAMCTVALGLLIGINWANSTWRKTGTMRFLSRIMETPDLGEKPNSEKKQDLDKDVQ